MFLGSGEIVAGHRIERPLGQGGMGEVYLATHLVLGRRVALKLLAPALTMDAQFRERFLAEGRLAASLDHPSIVTVYEAGELDGRLYLSMRYIEGSDLGVLLAGGQRLAPKRAVHLLAEIAGALDAAHAAGLIHRDVKPGNILVAGPGTADERAFLADFGLVKEAAADAGLTRTGQYVGTAEYVAPDQIEGRPLDGRADVYALAAVLFHALAGRVPFEHDSEIATLWAHLNARPPAISAIRPELGALDPVFERGLAKDPADRPSSASALIEEAAAALEAATDAALTLPRHAPAPPRPRADASPAAPPSPTSPSVSRPRSRRATIAWVLGIALVVLVLAAFAVNGLGPPTGGATP